jgi:hypothetical protein
VYHQPQIRVDTVCLAALVYGQNSGSIGGQIAHGSLAIPEAVLAGGSGGPG